MTHKPAVVRAIIALALVALLTSSLACTQADKPLPVPENVTVERGPYAPDDNQFGDTLIVSWEQSTDQRVEGYVIFRAEQGIGASPGEKTEYELQALTIAVQYVDDEVRTTERYPTMRYFYQVAVISSGGELGPRSEEVSIEYEGLN